MQGHFEIEAARSPAAVIRDFGGGEVTGLTLGKARSVCSLCCNSAAQHGVTASRVCGVVRNVRSKHCSGDVVDSR